MAVEKWVAGSGVGFTWTLVTTAASLDTLANGNAVLGTVAVTNQTALDLFADFSFRGGSITTVAPNYLGIYLYPLLDDGSTYGDGRYGSAAAGPPPNTYFRGSIVFPVGTQAPVGALERVIMPPGTWKAVVYNQAGATLAGSGANTLYYRTYNRSVA
jgi:hypothetical protein